jgi:hypothetical protein
LLPFLYESLQNRAANNDRAAIVNRGKPVFEPMPNGVGENACRMKVRRPGVSSARGRL